MSVLCCLAQARLGAERDRKRFNFYCAEILQKISYKMLVSSTIHDCGIPNRNQHFKSKTE